ncbi:MAG: Fic family protein [Planctomycetota bacterium]|jgi:Fic family protein
MQVIFIFSVSENKVIAYYYLCITLPIMKKPSGKFIKCAGYESFIPNALPPDIDWNERLARSLSDADRLIGQLSGEGKQLPNPHLLIRPFIKREAVLSSRIEGTQATLGELLANDAGASVNRSPDDLKEVGNYVKALDHGIQRLESLPLSLRLIREIHEKLMEGVRGDFATPGDFRKSQNWIGPGGCTLQNATYIPPSPELMMDCLGGLENFIHNADVPPLVQAGLLHYQFEAIHPFLDGNGRVGRLLITLFLIERKILATPLLYLSAFFEATRSEYYSRLLAVSQNSEWNLWLEYFLNGIARMSEDALSRAERINTLIQNWREMVAGQKPKILFDTIGLLAENPFWTTKKIAERLNVAFTTAQRAINLLKEKQIVTQIDQAQRDRVFCSKAIMNILDEAPKINAVDGK